MSFSGYYPLGLRLKDQEAAVVVPDSISPEGEEVTTGLREENQWDLYQACDKVREGSRKKRAGEEEENGEDNDEEEQGMMRNPQKVIDGLLEVRAELDIVMDIVQVAEEQQFLSLTHIPHTVDARAAVRQDMVRQGLKRQQLKSIAHRLQEASGELQSTYMNIKFLEEVRELRRRWLVKEYRVAGGSVLKEDCVRVDISFSVETEEESLVSDRDSLGKYKFVIAAGQDGEACALLPHVQEDETVVVVGWQQIDKALRRLQTRRAWKYINARLESESERLSQSLGIHPEVHAAVMRLARSSVGDSPMDMEADRHHAVSGYKDVHEFSMTDLCASLFKQKALSMLAEAITWHRVPLIVRRATPTSPKSFLEHACMWIKNVSLWYDVSTQLTAAGNPSATLDDFIRRLSSQSMGIYASVMLYRGSEPESLVGSILIEENGSMMWESAIDDDSTGLHSGMNMGRLEVMHIVREVVSKDSSNPRIEVEYPRN